MNKAATRQIKVIGAPLIKRSVRFRVNYEKRLRKVYRSLGVPGIRNYMEIATDDIEKASKVKRVRRTKRKVKR